MVKIKQTEELSNSSYASKDGRYHCVITEWVENPAKSDDTPMIGAVKVGFEIVEGTEKSEIKKTHNEMFFPPDESKDGGGFNAIKLTRLCVAISGVHQPGVEVEITDKDAIGRQLVIELAHRTDKNNPSKIYFGLKGANLFHIDDAEVSDVPKSADHLDVIDPSLRKAPVSDLVSSAAPAASTTAATQPAMAGAGVGSAVDLDDI
jgi:hypothetical protein